MMKSTIAALALAGAAQALSPKPNNSLNMCPVPVDPEPGCLEQTVEIHLELDCDGRLKQDLTGTSYDSADALMFGGRMSSVLIPPYATVVFHEDVRLEGDVEFIFNDSEEPICVPLCDLEWTPSSAQAFFTHRYENTYGNETGYYGP